MVGSPGTGKTLLAKAIAGEAKCRSSRSQAPILLRCLLVSELRVFGICSSRQRSRLRALSSLMKLMLSVVSVVQVLAAE
jgi:DNA replication protein DnaC